jgi:hypothetical protein
MQLECTVFLTLDIQPTASKTEILLELQNYKIPIPTNRLQHLKILNDSLIQRRF